MEHKQDGQPEKLYEVALQLRESMHLMPKNDSKAERGYAFCGGAPALLVKAAPPVLTRAMSVNEAFKVIAASCIVTLQANQEGMLLGQEPEYLHQMRVSLRRLRSALGLFGSVIPRAAYPEISDGIKWLAEQLGPARDWDVFVTETLPPIMAHFSGQEALAEMCRLALSRQQHYNGIARTAVRSRRYSKLLLTWGTWIEQEGWRGNLADVQQQELAAPLDELARQMLDRRHKQLRKRGRHLARLNMAERHAVRIAAKKLRYSAEFFAELYSHKRVQGYLNALSGLQDVLGALNDTVTTQRLLESLRTPESGATHSEAIGMAVGWVACRGTQFLAGMGQTWDAFLQQKPFWVK